MAVETASFPAHCIATVAASATHSRIFIVVVIIFLVFVLIIYIPSISITEFFIVSH